MTDVPSLENISLEVLNDGLHNGLFSSLDLVRTYAKRIDEINPKLRAVIELNPDAFRIAEDMDKERKSGKVRRYEWIIILASSLYYFTVISISDAIIQRIIADWKI